MKKLVVPFLKSLLRFFEEPTITHLEKETQKTSLTIELQKKKSGKKKQGKSNLPSIIHKENPARDLMEMMEVPFLALSKNRKNPIIYESPDGTRRIKVTRHTGHFIASIYDWDIILFVARKMQEILNTGVDIPPRSIIIPRHEILKFLHKHDGKKEEKD